MKILSFGEILWDVYPNEKYIGGAPLNFAAHLARHGEEVFMLSSLGEDDLGKAALTQLEKWNINTDYVSVLSNKQTGKCLVTLDRNQIPDYNLLSDVAYDYIDCCAVDSGFDVLYFGTLALRSEYNFETIKKLTTTQKFNEIFVDINIRPPFYSYESIRFALENATVLKISSEELPIVAKMLGINEYKDFEDFAQRLKVQYSQINCIIITLGADGAYAVDCKNNIECYCTAEKSEVKSTVGAGDSFSAAFLYKYLKNEDLQDCINYASKIAGYVVSNYDAVPDYNAEDFI